MQSSLVRVHLQNGLALKVNSGLTVMELVLVLFVTVSFLKGKPVAIVRAGDTAAEEALYLSKVCSEVHMIVRRDEMRASKVMQERVKNTANIHIYWNSEVDEVLGDKKVRRASDY